MTNKIATTSTKKKTTYTIIKFEQFNVNNNDEQGYEDENKKNDYDSDS